MRRLLASLSCLLPLSVIALRGAPQDPEAAPPPFRLTVTIDGVEHQLVDGVAKRIELGGKQVALKADVAPLRHFAAAGVEFDFPRDMAFEFESSTVLRSWTLEGSDVTVMMHALAAGTAEDMIRGVLAGLAEIGGGAAAQPEQCTVRYEGADHPAKRAVVELGGTTIEDIVFGLDRDDADSVVVVLQHNLGEDGERTAECQRLLELFERTLVIAPK